MMKKLVLLLMFSVTLFELNAQETRLHLYTDYVFADSFNSYYGTNSFFEGKVEDGFRWGVGFEYLIQGRTALELQYLRQDTKAPTSYRQGGSGTNFSDFDIAINYIMVNSNRYFPAGERLEPFLGAGVGMGIFNVDDPNRGSSDTATKFAWQVRGGTNIWMSEKVGLKLQATLSSVVQGIGGGLYFGTGGSGVSVNSYSTIYQFSLGGGLVVNLTK